MMRLMQGAALFLMLSACAEESGWQDDTFTWTELEALSTDETDAVLALVHHETTGLIKLQVDIGLPEIAATRLVLLRDGADGVWGTDDDHRFASVRTLLHLDGLGLPELELLRDWADFEGWPDCADPLHGTFEGVSFLASEADHALLVANEATLEELDVEVGLDRRTAEAIVEARPLDTMVALTEVYWVGTAALLSLRDASVRFQ
jgi:hypothetical protein